jgi:putative ABC transport system ATP-binding protein
MSGGRASVERRPIKMVEAEAITRDYRSGAGSLVHAVRGVSLRLDAGELMAVVGRSGSGKSTLLHILGTLDRATSGKLAIGGRDVSALSDHELAGLRAWTIGFVFQNFCLMDGFNALENVANGVLYRGVGRSRRSREAMVALESVGLADRATHLPSELSGGERQRVALARAIVGGRRLLLADEPTGNLDSETGRDVWTTLRRLADGGLAIVAVTHDADAVRLIANRSLQLKDGVLSGEG